MDSAAAATVSLSSSSLKVETRVRQVRWRSHRVALPNLADEGTSPLVHGAGGSAAAHERSKCERVLTRAPRTSS
eukprot:scaffold28641_cov31-Tisochrysis_lutea.AAC.6